MRATRIFEIRQRNEARYIEKQRQKQLEEERLLQLQERNNMVKAQSQERKSESNDAVMQLKMEQYYISKKQQEIRNSLIFTQQEDAARQKILQYQKVKQEEQERQRYLSETSEPRIDRKLQSIDEQLKQKQDNLQQLSLKEQQLLEKIRKTQFVQNKVYTQLTTLIENPSPKIYPNERNRIISKTTKTLVSPEDKQNPILWDDSDGER